MTVELKLFVEAVIATIRDHTDELTALDQAVGDGDHGINMKRGFDAVAELGDDVYQQPHGAVLQKIGMTLVMKVGGASGPLYGSLFMGMGKALGDDTAAAVIDAFAEGVTAVKARGKADTGEKTMLDVLVPVSELLKENSSDLDTMLDRVVATAERGLEATRDMRATKGRASFLGERSIGHIDPGAMSSCLMIKTVCAHAKERL